jgi:hypothetical protein
MTLFALDEATKEKEWGSVHTEVRAVICALTPVLSSLRDVITMVGQVQYGYASDLHFSFSRP